MTAETSIRVLVALATLACGVGCKQVTMTAPATVNPMLIGPVRTIGGHGAPGWQHELGPADVKTEIQSFAMASSSTSQSGNVRTTTTTSQSAKSSELQVDWAVVEATHGDGRKTVGVQSIHCSNWGFFFIATIWSQSTCNLEAATTAGGPPSARPSPPPFGGPGGPPGPPPPPPGASGPRCARDADCGAGQFCDSDDMCKSGAPSGKAARPAPAAAPPSGSTTVDTVFMKNGGRVRGKIMTDEPTGVSLQLPDGTTRKLKRDEVERVEYAK